MSKLPELLVERYRKFQHVHPGDQGAGRRMFQSWGHRGVNYFNAMIDITVDSCKKYLCDELATAVICKQSYLCHPKTISNLPLPLLDISVEFPEPIETLRGLLAGFLVIRTGNRDYIREACKRSGLSFQQLSHKTQILFHDRPGMGLEMLSSDGSVFWQCYFGLTEEGVLDWVPQRTINLCPHGECYFDPDGQMHHCPDCLRAIGFYMTFFMGTMSTLKGSYRQSEQPAAVEIHREKATYARMRIDAPHKKDPQPVEIIHEYHIIRTINLLHSAPIRPSRQPRQSGQSWLALAKKIDPQSIWYVSHTIESYPKHLRGHYWRKAIIETLHQAGKEQVTEEDIEQGITVDIQQHSRPVPMLAKNIQWGVTKVTVRPPNQKILR